MSFWRIVRTLAEGDTPDRWHPQANAALYWDTFAALHADPARRAAVAAFCREATALAERLTRAAEATRVCFTSRSTGERELLFPSTVERDAYFLGQHAAADLVTVGRLLADMD